MHSYDRSIVALPKLYTGFNNHETLVAFYEKILQSDAILMFHSFKSIETFPSRHIVKKYMSEVFKQEYPNTRIFIDATEFPIERPSSLLSQACTLSAYSN